MAYLGAFYRTYALDFWGFGESGKKRDSYSVQDFVSLVDQFMDRLGIECAPLVGHSMGGQQPPRFDRHYRSVEGRTARRKPRRPRCHEKTHARGAGSYRRDPEVHHSVKPNENVLTEWT